MSKRKKFLITSVLLSIGFILIQFGQNFNRLMFIGILTLLTLILFTWSLWEGLGKNMSLLTLVLPVYFTSSIGVFWFLLPSSVFARIPILIFFAVGIYVLCLTMNIYTVSAVRTIALFRAARGVGFVLTLITAFLAFDTVFSLRMPFYFLVPTVFLISFPLFVQGYWSVNLDHEYNKEIIINSLISSLIVAEIALALFVWPVTVVVGSLFITVTIYVLLGLGQAKLEDRLFASVYREHLVVGAFVFIAIFLATHWG